MLTADDRALLRQVFRAARKKGWRRDPIGPCGRERGSRYWADSYDSSIELDAYGYLKTPISEVECVMVPLAVDVLVAVGVLPVEFSSAYKAGHANGHEEAYYASKTQWGIRRTGYKSVRITSDTNARSLLRNFVVPAEMVMREVGPWEVVATNADLLARRNDKQAALFCDHAYIGNAGEFTCTRYVHTDGWHWNSLAEFGWTDTDTKES